METAGTDEKIALLVRSILEAVDARLGAVREEIRTLAEDVRARQVLTSDAVADLERRLTRQQPAEPSIADERLAQMQREIELLRAAIAATGGHAHPASARAAVTATRYAGDAPRAAVLPGAAPSPAPAASDSAIDLDRLTSLLSERLGNLQFDPCVAAQHHDAQ